MFKNLFTATYSNKLWTTGNEEQGSHTGPVGQGGVITPPPLHTSLPWNMLYCTESEISLCGSYKGTY